jgi:hypothetical protein
VTNKAFAASTRNAISTVAWFMTLSKKRRGSSWAVFVVAGRQVQRGGVAKHRR